MKVIVPTNNKGGVGKTKVSTIFAEYFSICQNYKILAIDFDPQCNFSTSFLKMQRDPAYPEGHMPPIHHDYDENDPDNQGWDGRSSIADIFYAAEYGVIPYQTHIKNLDIIPAHAAKLLAAEAVKRNEVVEKIYNQLSLFLSSPDVQEAYDIVIIDTAPSKGPLTVAAIKAATHIVIPSLMEHKPIEGVYGMLQLWMQESIRREPSKPIHLIGILPNLYKSTILHRDMLASLKDNPSVSKYVMPVKLSNRTAFAEVDVEGSSPRTVFNLPDTDPAKMEALALCQYVDKEVFKDE